MKNPPLAVALAALIFIATFGGNKAYASLALADLYIPAQVTSVGSYVSADSTAIKVNTLVKGFASNDPYFPKVVSVPKAGFFSFARANMGSLLKANAWWVAFSIAAGYIMTDDGPVIVGNYYDASKYFDRGNCNNGTLLNSNLSECEARTQQVHGSAFKKWISPGWYQCSGTTYQSGFCGGSINPVKFYRQFQKDSSTGYAAIMLFPSGTQLDPPTQPVPDARLESDFLTVCAANPLYCADAFQDPQGVPYPELFPNTTYLPNVNPADEPFLNCYFSGQLQTSNPSASCYATQDTYDRIKALADALIASQTPEGQASAANATLKDPLTQRQLEETLKKQDEATKQSLGELPKLDTLIDPYNQFEQKVKDTPQDEINELPDNNYSISGQGRCYVIEKPIGIMGTTITLSTREFCDAYYYPYFLPILTWFFYVATGIYVWFSLRDAYSRRV
ncbi:hypothetical protein OB934_07665 [Aeromonas salmonicida]|uniref:hypothetical protein n=1 Tax=Aeromonas salmonicida TaxID=645 RepID=UPI00259FD5B9|nr:hypothetical protein [Aeromonas salmonicida]MDM5062665.1 hypothetical protein [Aeromonas salmonicida]MDM5062673.1 hypothetical protein [Aeromonas salmonicida]